MTEKTREELATIIAANKEKPNLGNIDLHKTRELLMDAGAILLDVRPPAKVVGENAQEADIPSAIYAPYPEFADYLDELPSDHTTPIVCGCVKGWFANRVMGYLEMLGYANVYVLDTDIAELVEVHKAHTEK